MVRGPMMAEVIAGWLSTKAIAISLGGEPVWLASARVRRWASLRGSEGKQIGKHLPRYAVLLRRLRARA